MDWKSVDEPFEWEQIEDYAHVTGNAALDKALAYFDPKGPLKQHLQRREVEEGRDAVVADLQAIIDADGDLRSSDWLKRYSSGVAIEDL
jgi:hypothetical protein